MTEIRLGCSGWSYKDWIGPFYNEKITPNLMLPFYAKIYDTVEINSTFYALPKSVGIVEHWYKITPKNFIFSVKFPKRITHETLGIKKLTSEINYIQEFYRKISALKEKLGPILVQLPPKFNTCAITS
ncbi:MAG: DUF72 domain-containing protein [Candidatus Helarchaeota archaeon]